MTTWYRCGGWVFFDPDLANPGHVCINCGWRPSVSPLAPIRPVKVKRRKKLLRKA